MDLEMDSSRHGLVVPETQPVEEGLVVVKVSPLDAKTFLVLATGKMVTLPGDRLVVDQTGKTALCVWDNAGSFHLTMLDYRKMRLVVPTTPIVEPKGWYTNGLAYFFEGTDGTQYTIDLFTKKVTKAHGEHKDLTPMSYVLDPATLSAGDCCGAATLGE